MTQLPPPKPGSADEAAERNARAVMEGNLAQIMADITPDVMAQLMQLGASGGLTPQTMPGITGYEVINMGPDGEAEVFEARFLSEVGTATLATKWKQLMGQWKIVEVALVRFERFENTNA